MCASSVRAVSWCSTPSTGRATLSPPDNVIGGTSGAQANVIHDNKGAGVRVNGGAGNSILTNRFFANGGLGILLRFQGGVGFNDPKDPDGGTNNRQNYTVLTSAERNSATGETTITGSLNSNPN